MADTKNYGLIGVGDDVQFGKGGGRLVYSTGASDFAVTSDGSTLVHLRALDPVGDTDVATKLYVDNIASGLDPKESVQVATTANLSNFTTGGNNGQFTGVPASIDGVTLAEGDRILVKDQSTTTQNGIYVVTATTTTIQRAPDHDGTPAGNVSGGNFVFVEGGSTYTNTGWVLQGDGALTVNTDAIVWVQFSGTGTFTAGDGISLTSGAFDLDFVNGGGLTSATAIAGADQIAFADASNADAMQLRTMTNVLADLDIVTAAADGILVRTAADTYASRTLTASAVAGEEGITITDGAGATGNPTIGVDIAGTTALAVPVATGDSLLMYDTSAGTNLEVTVDQLKTFMNAGTSSTSITEGDTTLSVADTGTDGTMTLVADSTTVLTIDDTVATFQNGLDITMNTGSTLTITDLTDNDVLIAGTGGLVEDSGGNLTFDGTTLTVTGAAQVDNVNIDGNTIAATDTNGNLIIRPDGTGQITLANGSGEEILELQDTATAVNGLVLTAGATGNNPTFSANATGSETNVGIGFVTKGTGALTVDDGAGTYETRVTADDDIPNKKYVDDAIAATGGSGTLDSVTGTVDLASATAQNIGPAGGIPAGATVMSVTVEVTTASDAATTLTVGDGTTGAAAYMAATENDPEVLGIYIADGRTVIGGSAVQAQATVATPSTGAASATVIITFRHA